MCRRLLLPRTEGQRCQQWLQPKPGLLEMAGVLVLWPVL